MIESKIKGKIIGHENCIVRWEEKIYSITMGTYYKEQILISKEIIKELKDLLTD